MCLHFHIHHGISFRPTFLALHIYFRQKNVIVHTAKEMLLKRVKTKNRDGVHLFWIEIVSNFFSKEGVVLFWKREEQGIMAHMIPAIVREEFLSSE